MKITEVTVLKDGWCEDQTIISIYWAKENFGFGVATLYEDRAGKWTADMECLGKDFLKEVLCAFAEKIEIKG